MNPFVRVGARPWRALALAANFAFALPWLSTTAYADYYDGLTAYQGKAFTRAIDELEPLATQGDARAQTIVGLMYRDGQGVPQDFVRAHQWLNLAAAAGQAAAAPARDELAERMDRGQIAEAQRLAAAWQPQPAAGPAAPATAGAATGVSMPVAAPLTHVETRELQRQLVEHGYEAGSADGVVGPRTLAAIRQYQADAALPVDAAPTLALLDHLRFVDPPVRNPRALADHGWTALPATSRTGGTTLAEATTSAAPVSGVWSQPPSASLARIYIMTVQEALTAKGYRPGPIDGIAGPRTRGAIRRYQSDHGLPATGIVSQALVNHLRLVTGGASTYSASAS